MNQLWYRFNFPCGCLRLLDIQKRLKFLTRYTPSKSAFVPDNSDKVDAVGDSRHLTSPLKPTRPNITFLLSFPLLGNLGLGTLSWLVKEKLVCWSKTFKLSRYWEK